MAKFWRKLRTPRSPFPPNVDLLRDWTITNDGALALCQRVDAFWRSSSDVKNQNKPSMGLLHFVGRRFSALEIRRKIKTNLPGNAFCRHPFFGVPGRRQNQNKPRNLCVSSVNAFLALELQRQNQNKSCDFCILSVGAFGTIVLLYPR